MNLLAYLRKLTGRSRDVRKMTNSELASELYDVILDAELKDRHATVLMESAERLDTFKLECIEHAQKN